MIVTTSYRSSCRARSWTWPWLSAAPSFSPSSSSSIHTWSCTRSPLKNTSTRRWTSTWTLSTSSCTSSVSLENGETKGPFSEEKNDDGTVYDVLTVCCRFQIYLIQGTNCPNFELWSCTRERKKQHNVWVSCYLYIIRNTPRKSRNLLLQVGYIALNDSEDH